MENKEKFLEDVRQHISGRDPKQCLKIRVGRRVLKVGFVPLAIMLAVGVVSGVLITVMLMQYDVTLTGLTTITGEESQTSDILMNGVELVDASTMLPVVLADVSAGDSVFMDVTIQNVNPGVAWNCSIVLPVYVDSGDLWYGLVWLGTIQDGFTGTIENFRVGPSSTGTIRLRLTVDPMFEDPGIPYEISIPVTFVRV